MKANDKRTNKQYALQLRSPEFLASKASKKGQNWESEIIALRGIEGSGPI